MNDRVPSVARNIDQFHVALRFLEGRSVEMKVAIGRWEMTKFGCFARRRLYVSLSLVLIFFHIVTNFERVENDLQILFRTRNYSTTEQSTAVDGSELSIRKRFLINYLSVAGTFVSTWDSARCADRENSHCELNGCGTRRSRAFPRGAR